LKTIDISGCIMLTDEGILQLTQHCCMIESLALSRAGLNGKGTTKRLLPIQLF